MKSFIIIVCIVLLLQCVTCHQHHHHHHHHHHDDDCGDDRHDRVHRHNHPSLNLVYEWKDLEYDFPSEKDKKQAMSNGNYVPGNGVPIDVDVYYTRNGDRKLFMTIPRFTTGIPMTLVTISKRRTGPGGPILKPYPNYDMQSSQGKNCDGITSVFRVMIDHCKQMWVLDTGRVGDNQLCPPQLLVFDLHTDELIHRYKFPTGQFKPGVSLFVTPIVDVRDPPPQGSCKNSKVYIADVTGYGIVVYDSTTNTSWRTDNQLTRNEPSYEIITVAGETFTLPDGVLGMAVSPNQRGRKEKRNLYFHALAGIKEHAVPLEVLDNKKLWETNTNAMPNAFTTIGSRNIQSAAEAIDSKGNLIFGLMDPPSIASWNINTPYSDYKIRITNNQTLQFASGMKVIRNKRKQEELYVLTCRFQKVMTGTMDRKNEINFRIQGNLVDQIIRN